jgi:hypothetical protein
MLDKADTAKLQTGGEALEHLGGNITGHEDDDLEKVVKDNEHKAKQNFT